MTVKEISSPDNATFKTWKSLLESKGIKAEKQAILSGAKLVNEFLRDFPGQCSVVLLPPKGEAPAELPDIPVYRLSSPLFNILDSMGTAQPLLVVHVPELNKWDGGPAHGLELILALSDPGNLGACLRSAEAFGVNRVILCSECASPFLPRAMRSASLATFRLNIAVAGKLEDLEITNGYGLDMIGDDLRRFKWPKDLYLVVGEEGRGLPDHLPLRKLKIAMAGKTESLNAMAAASIALFSYSLAPGPA